MLSYSALRTMYRGMATKLTNTNKSKVTILASNVAATTGLQSAQATRPMAKAAAAAEWSKILASHRHMTAAAAALARRLRTIRAAMFCADGDRGAGAGNAVPEAAMGAGETIGSPSFSLSMEAAAGVVALCCGRVRWRSGVGVGSATSTGRPNRVSGNWGPGRKAGKIVHKSVLVNFMFSATILINADVHPCFVTKLTFWLSFDVFLPQTFSSF